MQETDFSLISLYLHVDEEMYVHDIVYSSLP